MVQPLHWLLTDIPLRKILVIFSIKLIFVQSKILSFTIRIIIEAISLSLGYTYLALSGCQGKYFSNFNFRYPGFDLYKYTEYQYRFIKEVRIGNDFANLRFSYTYQFNTDDNVSEVLVKTSSHGGMLQDYKIKFYY